MVSRHENKVIFCRAEKYRKNSKVHSQNFEIKNAEIPNLSCYGGIKWRPVFFVGSGMYDGSY